MLLLPPSSCSVPLAISIANQPRRICSLKRWSIDSASLRPYLAGCSARDWLLRRWRCIIKIKIGYCPAPQHPVAPSQRAGYRRICQLRFGPGIVVTEIRLGGVPFGPGRMKRLLCKQIQGRGAAGRRTRVRIHAVSFRKRTGRRL